MPKVRAGADKWKSRSAAAQSDYVKGVTNPRRSWAESTSQAAGNWAQGVQEAAANNRFASGVRRAGDAKWQQNAKTLGAQRFAQGVQASGDNYARGFDPYRQVIENTNLPERGPKGDPRNLERVRVLDEALHNTKLQQLGS